MSSGSFLRIKHLEVYQLNTLGETMSESKYESESEDETYTFYREISKFNYFTSCASCRQVKNRPQILPGKCEALHGVTHMITDYYCSDT